MPRTRDRRFVGVSSFGFGGTNAHVILADPPKTMARPQSTPRYLMLSAQSEASLRALAANYAARLTPESKDEARQVIAATAYRRERMRERLLLPAEDPAALQSALRSFADSGTIDPTAARGAAIDGDKSVVFVFSGNGAQWEGMGRTAFRRNADFRKALRDVDAHFAPLAGWSLEAKLASPDLERDLARTSVAQPLIFAIQAASVRALAAVGVRPSLTMGHSVGEVAAAEAAGALSLTGCGQGDRPPQSSSGGDREYRRHGRDHRASRSRCFPGRGIPRARRRGAQFLPMYRGRWTHRSAGGARQSCERDAEAQSAAAGPCLSVSYFAHAGR